MFEYIDYIKAVNECGSFTKAAEKLYITQPALSLVIKKAEAELGFPLFIRGKRNVTLTEEGIYYLQAADEVAAIEQRIKDQLVNGNSRISGKINIGAAGICMRYIVPEILARFNKLYPDVKVEVTEESFYHLRDLLLRNELDLVLDTESYHPEILHERLFPNTLFYAIPTALIESETFLNKGMTAEDVIANRYLETDVPKISMSDVMTIPFLSLQPRNELYARAEMLFNYYNCRPETLMHFNQQLTSYRFAQRGFGATFIADTLIRVQPSDKLRFYLFDYDLPERWISIGYKKDRYRTKAISVFIETAKSLYP